MKNNWLKYFLIVILIVVILGMVASQIEKTSTKEVGILTFVDEVGKGNFKKIWILDNQLLGESKSGALLRASKEPGISFWEILKDRNALDGIKDTEIKTSVAQWKDIASSFFFNIIPFILIIWIFWRIFFQAQKGAGQIFSFSKSGVKVYNPQKDPKITFNDVAGLKEPKEELYEFVEFLKNPEKFSVLGAQVPRGALLVGPAGCGKTLLARAVAGEASVPFFYISGSEFVELFVGIGSARVRDLFTNAKKSAPAIIFIDEIDAVGRMRGAGIGGGHDEREQTLNQILVEMDGFDKETKLIVLAATNRPDILDPALMRPGRFDRRIMMDLPDIKERQEILELHLKNKKIGKLNVRQIAERTPGFSGADLANLCNESAILAVRKGKTEVNQDELRESIEKILLGPERKSRVISKKEKEVAAYHEAGHAIVAHFSKYATEVSKISIISRGRVGGYTLKFQTEEKNFHFKKEFLDELAVLLGGYSSELMQFNDISTGASNDLQVATNIAHMIVTRYGMSEKLGPITLGRARELIFLGREIAVEKDYSEKTAEIIDEEVKALLSSAFEQAKKLIKSKKAKITTLAKYLIEKEVIEKEEFEAMMKK
ncbi:MAG: ATP-dependent zinc metalloprotease FtsH [Patescibacteria group bacterium]